MGSIQPKEFLASQEPGDLISVVVPVYNAEQYLEHCVDSILSQSYPCFELILVDDGSFDGSAELCDHYALRDRRIITIHKENGGQSSARNAGMEIACGEYLTFVDSDDYIHKDYLRILLAFARLSGAEITQALVNITFSQTEDCERLEDSIRYCVADHSIINSLDYKVAPCAKLYARSVYGAVRFPNWRVNEDDAAYYRFAYHADRICLVSQKIYQYVQSENSVMRNKEKDIPLDFIDIYRERIEYFKSKNEDRLTDGSYQRLCIVLILDYIGAKKNRTNLDNRDEMLRVLSEMLPHIRRSKYVPLAYKICFCLFRIMPDLMTNVILTMKLR